MKLQVLGVGLLFINKTSSMKTMSNNFDVERLFDFESEDTFLEVKDIKEGDVIYECDNNDYGVNYEFTAISNAERTSEGWICLVEDNEGETFEIFVSGKTDGVYLPKFYRVPQYLEQEDGNFYYPVK
jgi:hypothetical protein